MAGGRAEQFYALLGYVFPAVRVSVRWWRCRTWATNRVLRSWVLITSARRHDDTYADLVEAQDLAT